MLKYFRNLTLNVSDFLLHEQVGECWKLKESNSSPSTLPVCAAKVSTLINLLLFQMKKIVCQLQKSTKTFSFLIFFSINDKKTVISIS